MPDAGNVGGEPTSGSLEGLTGDKRLGHWKMFTYYKCLPTRTLTHPTPPSNLHLPMEAWLFCIFSEHLLHVNHIPSYPSWWPSFFFFVTLIDLDIASSPLGTPLQNPLAPKTLESNTDIIGYFIMERKNKIYISLCKANSLQFAHQTSISLFHSSRWSI